MEGRVSFCEFITSTTSDVQTLIVNASTGIGLMMAKTLEHNGAIVYICGRRLEVLEKAAKENNVRVVIILLNE